MPAVHKDLIRRNRRWLHSIGRWLDDTRHIDGKGRYGCPARLIPLLDLPINDEPTYTDLLVLGAQRIARPISYLELGVSFGKNFYVLANALREAELWGFDREPINPVLERQFAALEGDTALRRYRYKTNRIAYLQGDILSAESWHTLAGRRFNLVFSDACHQAAALRHEARMLRELDLLDRDGFLMVWDDLDGDARGPLTETFYAIGAQLRRRYALGEPQVFLTELNGWFGQHEHRHTVGVINNIGLRAEDLHRSVDMA